MDFQNKIKSDNYKLIFEIQAQIVISTFEFYQSKGYSPVLLPITCGSISSPIGRGSDSVPVSIELFNNQTYLADSMQFNLEYLLRFGKSGVWYIMPSFRGENHSNRHLNQFFHSEVEITGNLEDVFELVQEYVDFITVRIYDNLRFEIEKFTKDLTHIDYLLSLNGKYPRITYSDALDLLRNTIDGIDTNEYGEEVITSIGEKYIMNKFGGIVWLINFPASLVPFYQASIPGKNIALCGDLLFGIGEVVGAGERHQNVEELISALNYQLINPQLYQWYIDLKKESPIKTSGFGLGIERYLMWLLKIDDIRSIPIFERLKGIESVP